MNSSDTNLKMSVSATCAATNELVTTIGRTNCYHEGCEASTRELWQ